MMKAKKMTLRQTTEQRVAFKIYVAEWIFFKLDYKYSKKIRIYFEKH